MGKTAMQLQNYNFHNINKDFTVLPVAALKIKPNHSFAKDFANGHIIIKSSAMFPKPVNYAYWRNMFP